MRKLILIFGQLISAITLAQTAFIKTKGAFEYPEIHNYCDSLYKVGLFNGNILIADKGNILYSASFGKANEKTELVLNEASIFDLASVSKQFTAMAIIMLKERGKLSLDDKIHKFIPELSFYKSVTIRQLLNHTSGLPDYFFILDSTFDKSKIATNKDVISALAKYKLNTVFPPNTKYEYSNTGYNLLASVIERVSGQSYADFLRENIFIPLDMKNSLVYCPRKSPRNLDNFACGYITAGSKRKIIPDSFPDTRIVFWLGGLVGEGSVHSTIIDLLKWDRALYSDKLCSKQSLKDIFSPAVLADKTKSNYGFGWEILEDKDYKKIVFHEGLWPGYVTALERHIENDKTIIVLQNLGNIDKPQISIPRLRAMIYPEKTVVNTTPVQADSIKVPKKVLLKYCGDYIDTRMIPLSIFLKGENIYRHMFNKTPDAKLVPVSTNKFVYADKSGRSLEFAVGKNGEVISLTVYTKDGPFTYDRKK